MRVLQNAVVILMLLFITGFALASNPNPNEIITYSYSPDPSTAKPLHKAIVTDAFYVFIDPSLDDQDIYEVIFFIEYVAHHNIIEERTEPPFSTKYDPSNLSSGIHQFIAVIEPTGKPTRTITANFSIGVPVAVEVQFTAIADSHLCPYMDNSGVTSKAYGVDCVTHEAREVKRTRLENVGKYGVRDEDDFVISLGDQINDLYYHVDPGWPFPRCGIMVPVPYKSGMTSCAGSEYGHLIKNNFPLDKKPFYLVLGNHDIRNYMEWVTYGDNPVHRGPAKLIFNHAAENYGIDFIETYQHLTPIKGWDFYFLNSGESASELDLGSCVSFSQAQLDLLEKDLDEQVGKTAILFWHVSPEGEIRGEGHTKDICLTPDNPYFDTIKDNRHKIKAIFTGHVHNFKQYVWYPNNDDDSKIDNTSPVTDPGPDGIMMFVTTTTGLPKPENWDGNSPLYMNVGLYNDGSLGISNADKIQWADVTPMGAAPIPDLYLESFYSQADPCFEQDNDGDGWFNNDKIDCPSDTSTGTELDYDYDQENFTIEAKLKKDGTVLNYTPGQYYTVSKVKIGHVGKTPHENFWITQHYEDCTSQTPPISKLKPAKGGGAVAVVVVGPDGVARQIANAKTLDYTDQLSGISIVSVKHTDSDTNVQLENVPEDYYVYLYVKFALGLKHAFFSEFSSCDVETSIGTDDPDPVVTEILTLEVVDHINKKNKKLDR